MDKKFYSVLLGGLALVMASCSNDEPTKGENQDNVNGDKYMAFSITNLNNDSRADDYEPAAGTEGNISKENLYFLFFDRNGNAFMLEGRSVNGTAVNTNMVKPENISWEKDQTGSETLSGTLVLGKPAAPFLGQTPAQVLCVANSSTKAMSDLGGKNLNSVLETTTNAPDWTDGVFLMTNATYVKGSNVIVATSTDGCIKNDPGEAASNPVTINLERVAAKVRANYNDDYVVTNNSGTTNTTTFELNGVQTELHAQIQGWRLMNYATKAWGFKKLSASYTFEWAWNDETNARSYWANSLAECQPSNITYDLTDATQFTLTKFSSTYPTQNIAYCYENTLYQDAAITNRTAKATGIVVKVALGTVTDGTFTPVDMVKFAGKLYTVAHFKKMVEDQFKSGHPDATVNRVNFVRDDETKNTWKATVTYNTNQTGDMTYIYNNFLWWENGVTSYWINIKHFGGLTGVVRNHIYDYTVTDIYGLGIPGNNPDTPEEKESYMAAALRVLNWRVVSNNVILQ